MIDFTEEQIDKAAKIVKIITLSNNPMMDSVAIKLNSGPTYDEKRRAKVYAKALGLATTNESVFDSAAKIMEERI